MSMIERVAEAIANQMAEDDNDNESLARAAIKAMREPSEGMEDEGWTEWDWGAHAVWRAMIDAALAE